jgi:hypothetical protein
MTATLNMPGHMIGHGTRVVSKTLKGLFTTSFPQGLTTNSTPESEPSQKWSKAENATDLLGKTQMQILRLDNLHSA